MAGAHPRRDGEGVRKAAQMLSGADAVTAYLVPGGAK